MKGAIYQIAAILSLATAIHAAGIPKLITGGAKAAIGGRDVYENNVGSLFRRYPG